MPHDGASPIVPGHRDRPNIGTQQVLTGPGGGTWDVAACRWAFRQAIVEHADDFTKMAEEARGSGGGIHHRFAVGDGFVLVVDEWESVEHFQKFFATPDLQAIIAASGAAPQPPEITIAEAISTPDEY